MPTELATGNDSALPQDSAGDDSSQPQVSARDDLARDDGPAAQGTPAENATVDRQDASIVSDVSSLIFPSMPRRINQETLLDFMSMWTLMQRRMDGPTAPDAQSRPVVQTPTTTHDQSPTRRPETPVRCSRTPDRRPRTPVRRARVLDETRDSTRSRSPVRRSSSSESCIRDGSLVNFSAALNTEDKVKDRTLSDEEDDERSQKKVSAAQYQFRQAVTSSKGTFKVNPSKSRRAPRASLMYLGETESSDRVSWLDQPCLVDTMASTACISQGLKDDEDVEKTTLSEALNTSISTFKHLTVKQIFPREPHRLKVHRDAQYLPKPPAETRFSDSKAPASYQISQRMCLDTEELARRLAIYASLADSMVASVVERPKIEAVAGETDHYSRGPGSWVCSRFQPATSTEGCLAQELCLPASSLEHGENSSFRRIARPGSISQRTTEQSQGHPSGGQNGWIVCDFCSEDQRLQD